MTVLLDEKRNETPTREALSRIGVGRWPGLVFVQRVEQGKQIQRLLQQQLPYHNVPLITGSTSRTEKARIAREMREESPNTPVAVCTMTWATGVDIPPLRWVMWAGQGQAPIWFLQARGRGSRPHEGKDSFELIVIEDVDHNFVVQGQKRMGHLHEREMLPRTHNEDPTLESLMDSMLTPGENCGTTLSNSRIGRENLVPVFDKNRMQPSVEPTWTEFIGSCTGPGIIIVAICMLIAQCL